MPQGATTPESSLQTLPVPVTANSDVARWHGRIGVGRSTVSLSFLTDKVNILNLITSNRHLHL